MNDLRDSCPLVRLIERIWTKILLLLYLCLEQKRKKKGGDVC